MKRIVTYDELIDMFKGLGLTIDDNNHGSNVYAYLSLGYRDKYVLKGNILIGNIFHKKSLYLWTERTNLGDVVLYDKFYQCLDVDSVQPKFGIFELDIEELRDKLEKEIKLLLRLDKEWREREKQHDITRMFI